MIDRENVIENLEQNIRWIEEIECHQFPGWGNVTMAMRDAAELLKEQGQHEHIEAFLKDQEKIVLCKDCKHFKDNRCLNDNVHYSIDDCGCQPTFHVADDWFCAEGERR